MRRDILEGLLACDVVGFHNHDYTTHFLESCEKILYVYRTSEWRFLIPIKWPREKKLTNSVSKSNHRRTDEPNWH